MFAGFGRAAWLLDQKDSGQAKVRLKGIGERAPNLKSETRFRRSPNGVTLTIACLKFI
jgi:hypothetical protein